jgi:hypothetical protein
LNGKLAMSAEHLIAVQADIPVSDHVNTYIANLVHARDIYAQKPLYRKRLSVSALTFPVIANPSSS